MPPTNNDQVDGRTSHGALGNQFPEMGTNSKSEHSGIEAAAAAAPESVKFYFHFHM